MNLFDFYNIIRCLELIYKLPLIERLLVDLRILARELTIELAVGLIGSGFLLL